MFGSPDLFYFYLSVTYAVLLTVINLLFTNRENSAVFSASPVKLYCLSFIVRIIPVMLFPFASGYDIKSFTWAGQQILQHNDIYYGLGVRHYFSFLPTYGLLTAFYLLFSKITALPVYILMKLVIITFDSFIPIIIMKFTGSSRNGYLYSLSFIPVFVASYMGQFDAITLFFLLWGIFLVSKKQFLQGMVLLGISSIFKPWPVLFFFVFILMNKDYAQKIKGILLFLAAPALISGIYKTIIPDGNLITMIKAILLYNSSMGYWGPSVVFRYASEIFRYEKILLIPSYFLKPILIGLIIYISVFMKRKEILSRIVFIILCIYILSFGMAIQYFLWIVPFIIITGNYFLPNYFLYMSLYMIFFGIFHLMDFNFNPPSLPLYIQDTAGLILWIMFLFWGITELRISGIFRKKSDFGQIS